jgi:hypothetical protein
VAQDLLRRPQTYAPQPGVHVNRIGPYVRVMLRSAHLSAPVCCCSGRLLPEERTGGRRRERTDKPRVVNLVIIAHPEVLQRERLLPSLPAARRPPPWRSSASMSACLNAQSPASVVHCSPMGAKAVGVAVATLAAFRLSAEPSSTVRMQNSGHILPVTPHKPLPDPQPTRYKLRKRIWPPERQPAGLANETAPTRRGQSRRMNDQC